MAEDKLSNINLDDFKDESLLEKLISGKYADIISENKTAIIMGFIGIVLISSGLFFYKSEQLGKSEKIEVINATASEKQDGGMEIYVEASGAVQKPGVYEMKSGDRVEDLLIVAEGLAVNADRTWVEKNVNRAAKLIDGQKIYIPTVDEQSVVMSAKDASLNDNSSSNTNNTQTNLININTASQDELESLWGIGPVTGKNIIDHRPYSEVSELKTKGILKSNVYETNKDKMTVY